MMRRDATRAGLALQWVDSDRVRGTLRAAGRDTACESGERCYLARQPRASESLYCTVYSAAQTSFGAAGDPSAIISVPSITVPAGEVCRVY
jgi:hypothetical protein